MLIVDKFLHVLVKNPLGKYKIPKVMLSEKMIEPAVLSSVVASY